MSVFLFFFQSDEYDTESMLRCFMVFYYVPYLSSLQPNFIQPVTKDELTGPKSNLDLQSLAILKDPPDLDQGWAWVVLAVGFLANVLLGATIYASGKAGMSSNDVHNFSCTKH